MNQKIQMAIQFMVVECHHFGMGIGPPLILMNMVMVFILILLNMILK